MQPDSPCIDLYPTGSLPSPQEWVLRGRGRLVLPLLPPAWAEICFGLFSLPGPSLAITRHTPTHHILVLAFWGNRLHSVLRQGQALTPTLLCIESSGTTFKPPPMLCNPGIALVPPSPADLLVPIAGPRNPVIPYQLLILERGSGGHGGGNSSFPGLDQ